MRANYNARRTSVVFNPRGRVLGGLGDSETGGGANVPDSGGNIDTGGGGGSDTGAGQTAAEAAFNAATQAAANATAAAAAAAAYAQQQMAYEAASLDAANAAAATAAAAAYAQQQMDYEAASLQAANAATFAAAQMANEAAMLAAANALAASRASNAASAKTAANIANAALSLFGLPGMIMGLLGRATGATEAAILDGLNGRQLSYGTNLATADQALADARGYGSGEPAVLAEINKVQTNLDAAKKAGIEAAVTKMYQTYAKRNPDPAALAYWSQRFGPTITADEVMEFQQMLYANEPNLRPTSYTQQQINEAIRISKQTFSDADVITGLTRQGLTSEEAVAAMDKFYDSPSGYGTSTTGGGINPALILAAAAAAFFIGG